MKFNGTVEYTLIYDANGRLHSMTEGTTTHVYEYDSLDRLIRAYQKDANGNITVAVENTYDELGRAKGSTYAIGDNAMEYSVTYKTDSNLVGSLRMPDASEDSQMSVIDYTYDNFDRLTEKVISMSSMVDLSEEYEYYTYIGADGKRHTTSLVSEITLRSSNASGYDVVYSYVYDNLGNITDVYIEGIPVESYEYDSLGQLIREDNVLEDYTILYSYDQAGNLTSKEQFVCSTAPTWHMEALSGTGTLTSYTYGNSTWGDLLTSYGGTAISYDAIGNPTNWRNTYSMSWDARRLTNQRMNNSDWLIYTYNADGIRTQKYFFNDVEMYGTTHDYVLDGTNIIRETVTGDGNNYTLYYLYDESGSVIGFIYNNNYYYYQKNLQGDVIRILDYSGNVVVEYTYDAWGKVLSVTGSQASTIGQYNPFRYRSYYYDVETGFYYLQSRYYDPTVGRFLNADGIVGANGGIEGYNMFAYCNNNPVVFSDESGFALRSNTKNINDGGGTQTISSESESSLSPPYEADKFGWSGTVDAAGAGNS